MLKGPTADVRHFAEHVIAERAVRHGEIALIPSPDEKAGKHRHGHGHKRESKRPAKVR